MEQKEESASRVSGADVVDSMCRIADGVDVDRHAAEIENASTGWRSKQGFWNHRDQRPCDFLQLLAKGRGLANELKQHLKLLERQGFD